MANSRVSAIAPTSFPGLISSQGLPALVGEIPTLAFSSSRLDFLASATDILLDGPKDPFRLALAASMALWGWRMRPLERHWQARLVSLADFVPAGDPAAKSAAKLAKDSLALARRLPRAPDHVEDLFDAGLLDAEAALSALGRHWDALLGRPEAMPMLSTLADYEVTAPYLDRFLVESYACGDEAEAALEFVDNLPALWTGVREALAGGIFNRFGWSAEAHNSFLEAAKAFPWHVNLVLTAQDAITRRKARPCRVGEAVVAVYSHGKPEILAKTLAALAESGLGEAGIIALDNGASPESTAILTQALARFPKDRRELVSLPVNIGAPAARNWILTTPLARQARWVAFVDDDAEVEQGWLTELLAVARDFPKAGAIGLKIVDMDVPHRLQGVDFQLAPLPHRDEDDSTDVKLLDVAGHAPDLGLFDYVREADSVSGCCHIISMEGAEQVGGFDIRFTPTQFDDLERDLRLAQAGRRIYYVGRSRVRHERRSNLSDTANRQRRANVLANKMKLDSMYKPEQLESLAKETLNTLVEDWVQKAEQLEIF